MKGNTLVRAKYKFVQSCYLQFFFLAGLWLGYSDREMEGNYTRYYDGAPLGQLEPQWKFGKKPYLKIKVK